MLDAAARGLYTRSTTQHLLDRFALDHAARRAYARGKERLLGTTTLSVADTTVEVSRATIPEPTYLDPELTVVARLLDRLEPDDVFWDVGADKGLYASLAAAHGCEEVIAFEPHPVRREALIRNLRRNDLSGRVRSEALSDRNGTAAFDYRIQATDRVDDSSDRAAATFTAITARGDDLVESHAVPVPSVCKLDVEGAEFELLEGMEETLANPSCRLIYCELHDAAQRGFEGGPERVRELLESHGFEVSTVATRRGDGWTQPYVEARRDASVLTPTSDTTVWEGEPIDGTTESRVGTTESSDRGAGAGD
ncbi:FkbM family methyltransferase [Halovivax gelatinilyticus]|uniref:FkbM family methyltransferase n=1 Tax=Halovivax gelatinilyticus TaxID=2961597 RepID=UPI0020CA7978|nr:FkbM family methyltransferase [Halovivax gelatinilyticus]